MSSLFTRSPQQRFLDALDPPQQRLLPWIAAKARQAPPDDWIAWQCGPVFLGWLSPQRALWLSQALEHAELQQADLQPKRLHWDAVHCSAGERSEQLQAALESARACGLLAGWRNERFSFWAQPQGVQPPLDLCAGLGPDADFLSVERSGFRFLGMLSHAVHINGFTPEGHLWCGRRALSKATDPGMLDNVTAGGITSGESALNCAVRELEEEAGIGASIAADLVYAGSIRSARTEPQGYHDERLQVFNLVLPAHCIPANHDGEVSEFICLSPPQVLSGMARGEFTADAMAALVQGLQN